MADVPSNLIPTRITELPLASSLLTTDTIVVVQSGVTYQAQLGDALGTAYVPAGRTLTAGTGLDGGGDLSANRTFSLEDTAVVPAVYGSATASSQITVDQQGRITLASSITVTPAWSSVTGTPTTLAGYGITDAQPLDADLTALAALSTTGLVARTGAATYSTRTITSTGATITVTNGGGVAGAPNLDIADTAVTPGSYTNASITVDQQGRLTAASSGAAPGDVVGPASATDNAFARFDGITGKLIQNSTAATLNDTGDAVLNSATLTVALTVANGGTGAATFTDGALLLGAGTGAITALALTTDGAIVIGDGTTAPTTLAAFTSATGTLKHEQGGLEFNASAVADGDVVVGTGVGTMGLESGATFRTTVGLGTGDTPQFTGLELGHATDTTLTRVSAGVIAVEGATIYAQGGALGTPASGTLTNCTGLPQAGTVGLTTADSPQFAGVNLGHATDTTLTRAAAGVLAVEGVSQAALTGVNAARESFIIAVSDETTALTTGTAKVTFRIPYAFTVTEVRASVTTAPTGASLLTVDINEAGVSILSTKITIDASEFTSTTAVTPPVISDASLADDASMTIDIDQVGSTVAGAGLKVAIIGYKT